MSASSDISFKRNIFFRGLSSRIGDDKNRVENNPPEERDRYPSPQSRVQYPGDDPHPVQNAACSDLALHSPTATREVSTSMLLCWESPGRAQQPPVPRQRSTRGTDRPQRTRHSRNRVLRPLQTFHELFREGLGAQTQQVIIIITFYFIF